MSQELEITVNGATLFSRAVEDKNEAQTLVDDFADGAIWESKLQFVYREYDENMEVTFEEDL